MPVDKQEYRRMLLARRAELQAELRYEFTQTDSVKFDGNPRITVIRAINRLLEAERRLPK